MTLDMVAIHVATSERTSSIQSNSISSDSLKRTESRLRMGVQHFDLCIIFGMFLFRVETFTSHDLNEGTFYPIRVLFWTFPAASTSRRVDVASMAFKGLLYQLRC